MKALAAAVTAAVARAVAIVLGGVMLCAFILGAVGFALASFYTLLAPHLGPAAAAFATSGAALIVPTIVTVTILVVTRTTANAPGEIRLRAHLSAGLKEAIDWIPVDPRAATTLGALGAGVALGASSDIRETVLRGVDGTLAQGRRVVP